MRGMRRQAREKRGGERDEEGTEVGREREREKDGGRRELIGLHKQVAS